MKFGDIMGGGEIHGESGGGNKKKLGGGVRIRLPAQHEQEQWPQKKKK